MQKRKNRKMAKKINPYMNKTMTKVSKNKSINAKKNIKSYHTEMKENYENNDIGEMYADAFKYQRKGLHGDFKARDKYAFR